MGADVKFTEGASVLAPTPVATLEVLQELGFDGILVRTMDEAFPDLDPLRISEFGHAADAAGMFVQMGLGKINPYMTAELPRVRVLGGGSYLAGMERLIRICGAHGWQEAWTATGGYKKYPGLFAFERFRTDVDWKDQLQATARLVALLAPTLRANGVRLNIETHEEITTFEILRLVEEAGSDVLGVCLDPANLLVRGELVAPAVGRVASATHMTHLRDAIVMPVEDGLGRFLAPLGDGIINWRELLEELLADRPDMHLTIEGIGGSRAEMALFPDDSVWRAGHPDLVDAELEEIVRLAQRQSQQAASGKAPTLAELRRPEDRREGLISFLQTSLHNLREILAERRPTHP
ncbi:sugar phosphate isomerase/epimerase family protein [Paenarthrobacter sp. PH39-S1]|uniref:sugar phosphate isomerase/epimerase family protein n=1 Tax=Paenarthrobacter sp. PH39-S1 TaxID=3046204 RepID=UPI0024BB7B0C|nr:sugar phosphate isomerase/epimerase family protein [Paenarthrobacter sp. PH39-S1]MDJ0358184.1 sugar phosphate isomerase/epimerase family protein [Paenarthrobacter sp. PH39-S1]